MSGIIIKNGKAKNKDLMEELKSEFNQVVSFVILDQIFAKSQEDLESGELSSIFIRAIERIGASHESFPRQFLIMINEDCARIIGQINHSAKDVIKLIYQSIGINLYDELNIESIEGVDVLNVYRNDELFQDLSEKILGDIFTLVKRKTI